MDHGDIFFSLLASCFCAFLSGVNVASSSSTSSRLKEKIFLGPDRTFKNFFTKKYHTSKLSFPSFS